MTLCKMKYFREYIGEGQEMITRAEAKDTLSRYYRDIEPILTDLDSGSRRSIRIPGGYISAERDEIV